MCVFTFAGFFLFQSVVSSKKNSESSFFNGVCDLMLS